MISAASAAVERIQRELPAAYASVIKKLIEETEQDDHRALLLTGSLARGDALPGTDVDVRCIVRSAASRAFHREVRQGLQVELSVQTEEAARTQLIEQPMQVYAYLDGVALLDPDGALARLRSQAQQVFDDYVVPHSTKVELAEALSHPAEKIRVALAAGDLLKATYSLASVTWQLIEGLWAANDLPLPPNASVRPHLPDLRGPEDIERDFSRLFLADPAERAEVGLHLLDWIRAELTSG